MRRHHAVVVISCRYERGRIRYTLFQIVERRIGFQVFKHLLRILAGSIVACPVPTDCELVIAQHVHDSDFRNSYAEEVGALRHTCPHEQASIGTTHNRKFLLRRVTFAD